MKGMTLDKIAEATGGTLFCEENGASVEVTGVVIDNRNVEKGFLFIPIKGARVDGHSFIPNAFASGAAAVLSERELESPAGPYILVKNTEAALKDLAAYYRSCLTIPVIGIIGSVGKTSTKEMTASVLSRKFAVLKTEGNFNNEIGLPLTLFRINESHEAAVVEMGISDFGEMDRLGRMARPTAVIMTNIGQCHLENLKTRDGILKAKTEVFSHLTKPATVILNGDDDKLSTVKEVEGAEVVYYGKSEGAGVRIRSTESLGLKGVRAVFETKAGTFTAEIPLPGMHNVYNAAAATAAGLMLGMTLEEIRSGIEKVETIGGRSNFVTALNGAVIIDDCYNANPQSMAASLSVLSQAEGRKIAVLGDMGELGTDEKELHYGVGRAVAENGVDVLFYTGELAKEFGKAVKDAGSSCEVHEFEHKTPMIEALKKEIRKGDTVLVKASHFMEFGEVCKALVMP